jgi:hypothetical protein
LFVKGYQADSISVAAGTLNGDTGLKLQLHIYADTKPSYYELSDGLLQVCGGSHSISIPHEEL